MVSAQATGADVDTPPPRTGCGWCFPRCGSPCGIYASRRLIHGFSNPHDDQPARYVAILTHSGYEDYFRQVAEHVARTGMPDAALTAELMAQHQTVLGDPLPDPS